MEILELKKFIADNDDMGYSYPTNSLERLQELEGGELKTVKQVRAEKSKHATLDNSVIMLMRYLGVEPRICKYCEGEYYPYRTDTKKEWEKNKFCSSICKANKNLKPFKPTLTS